MRKKHWVKSENLETIRKSLTKKRKARSRSSSIQSTICTKWEQFKKSDPRPSHHRRKDLTWIRYRAVHHRTAISWPRHCQPRGYIEKGIRKRCIGLEIKGHQISQCRVAVISEKRMDCFITQVQYNNYWTTPALSGSFFKFTKMKPGAVEIDKYGITSCPEFCKKVLLPGSYVVLFTPFYLFGEWYQSFWTAGFQVMQYPYILSKYSRSVPTRNTEFFPEWIFLGCLQDR